MKCIKVERITDANLIITWKVTSYSNADGSATEVVYKTLQEAQNATPLLSQAASGLSTNPDVAIVHYNPDQTIDSAQYIRRSLSKDDAGEQSVKTPDKLTAQQVKDIQTLDQAVTPASVSVDNISIIH